MVVGSSASIDNDLLSGSMLPAIREPLSALGLYWLVFESRHNTNTYEVMVVVSLSLALLCYRGDYLVCETAVGNSLWMCQTLEMFPQYYVHDLTSVFNQQYLPYEKLIGMVHGKA